MEQLCLRADLPGMTYWDYASHEDGTYAAQLWMRSVWDGGETYHWMMGMVDEKLSHPRS